MLSKVEYAEFAEKINREMAWSSYGWENIVFSILTIVLTPFATTFLVGTFVIALWDGGDWGRGDGGNNVLCDTPLQMVSVYLGC